MNRANSHNFDFFMPTDGCISMAMTMPGPITGAGARVLVVAFGSVSEMA